MPLVTTEEVYNGKRLITGGTEAVPGGAEGREREGILEGTEGTKLRGIPGTGDVLTDDLSGEQDKSLWN